MLNVIILAYRDKTVKDLPQLGTVEEQQQQIFERYIGRMLEQRAARDEFSPQQSRKWLIWLAYHMKRSSRTDFYIDELRDFWIPTQQLRIIYRVLIGLYAGLGFGLLVGLYFGLYFGLLTGLLAGLLLGLLPRVRGYIGRGGRNLAWSWKNLRQNFLYGLYHGGLAYGLLAGLLAGLRYGLLTGLRYGLLLGLLGGGEAYFQHYILRYILKLIGAIPWHYVRFLDEAVERILLQKVGEGYQFIHPLFLDYLASQGTTTADVSEQSSLQKP